VVFEVKLTLVHASIIYRFPSPINGLITAVFMPGEISNIRRKKEEPDN
jgi:hypothetical protein